MKKIIIITFGILLLSLVVFLISIPIVNDKSADRVKNDLEQLPLPDKTEFIESVSRAGKLVGNGNGMQYFGAILMKSELSLEELEKYYSKYRENEWDYVVERQEGKNIDVIDTHSVMFSSDILPADNYYIIYSWGNGISPFDELDIRGH